MFTAYLQSRSRVKVRFCDLDDGVPRLVLVPVAALEWPDAWIPQYFPELCKRRPLGVEGLVVDAFVALGIVTARRAVLSILQRSLSSSPSRVSLQRIQGDDWFIRLAE